MEVSMKNLFQTILAGLTAVLLLAGLFACQAGSPAMTAGLDLTPDMRSTGSPPLIPHDIDQYDSNDICLGCHQTGEMGAPKYPDWHATLVDCKQCHIPETAETKTFKTDY